MEEHEADIILASLSKDELLRAVKRITTHLQNIYGVRPEDVLRAEEAGDILIPTSIFALELSPAEALVKYLKENKSLSYSKIAKLIGRDERGVWGSYQRAQRKRKARLEPAKPYELIPLQAFTAQLSVFEAAVLFLKDTKKLRSKKIAELLKKKPSTISTVYHRALKKGGQQK